MCENCNDQMLVDMNSDPVIVYDYGPDFCARLANLLCARRNKHAKKVVVKVIVQDAKGNYASVLDYIMFYLGVLNLEVKYSFNSFVEKGYAEKIAIMEFSY